MTTTSVHRDGERAMLQRAGEAAISDRNGVVIADTIRGLRLEIGL